MNQSVDALFHLLEDPKVVARCEEITGVTEEELSEAPEMGKMVEVLKRAKEHQAAFMWLAAWASAGADFCSRCSWDEETCDLSFREWLVETQKKNEDLYALAHETSNLLDVAKWARDEKELPKKHTPKRPVLDLTDDDDLYQTPPRRSPPPALRVSMSPVAPPSPSGDSDSDAYATDEDSGYESESLPLPPTPTHSVMAADTPPTTPGMQVSELHCAEVLPDDADLSSDVPSPLTYMDMWNSIK